jgi:hypothetical protein
MESITQTLSESKSEMSSFESLFESLESESKVLKSISSESSKMHLIS